MTFTDSRETEFTDRHIGPSDQETHDMLAAIGVSSVSNLLDATLPERIRVQNLNGLPKALSEYQYLEAVRRIGAKNKVFKNYIGLGYYGTITPSVILRNVFENPGWYTQYTPYQAEIAQGRLECLLNFQTMVSDLTGLPIANASLLDEGTAAAEAMHMLYAYKNKGVSPAPAHRFFVDQYVFTQTLEVLKTRSEPLGIELVTGSSETVELDDSYFGALVQYPNAEGRVQDYRDFIQRAHLKGIYVCMAADILALSLLVPPGELDADVAVGSTQRFGIPLGYGGPHAAYFATKDEFKRLLPGRIIGVSVDAQGHQALRMALQTREQHIRREKATSNICTAQALLANMSALYAVYHGPEGIKKMARRIASLTQALAMDLQAHGFHLIHESYFDTLKIQVGQQEHIRSYAEKLHINLRYYEDGCIGVSIDETTDPADIDQLASIFLQSQEHHSADAYVNQADLNHIPASLVRSSSFMEHPVFNTHHSESEMMRYIRSLEDKDLALNRSMIPLGSCTMKLNAATELIPLSWPEFAHIHPWAPEDQTLGYQQVLEELSEMLCAITGFQACSLQPNSGAQGEYTGLMVIRAYHRHRGGTNRTKILIPISAHGTNPASAVMAGMQVIVVACDEKGNIDISDLKSKAEHYRDQLAGLMVTYPSTHGVYEESIVEICQIVHECGGLVYMDGANMNAQVGLTNPGYIGADVCHLNLHKTFAIPHGGGGPGMGPICVRDFLAEFLPAHPSQKLQPAHAIHSVSAAAYGSASILLISYGYIRLLGQEGLTKASSIAILNANYMKARLQDHYPILYSGKNGMCAHEFIIDLRPFKAAGIEAEDVAKRLMDYGFHAPTLSFPVAGTLMVEPTESEDKSELDRFCDAMIAIRQEISEVENGKMAVHQSALKNAPHTLAVVCADEWPFMYSRTQAAFPLSYLRTSKFWPSVARVNNTLGDRNLICTCAPMEAYA